MKVFLGIICFCLMFNLQAQGNSQGSNSKQDTKNVQVEVLVTGTIKDKTTSQPLEYATIAFSDRKLNKVITGGISNKKGEFSIAVPIGIYDIAIEFITFKKVTLSNKSIISTSNIGIVYLEEDAEMLQEVELETEQTTVEIKLDKKIYNVGKDLTVSGGSVSDVLDNVPSVSVDVEGNVALRGNDNVRILINGKPSGLVGLNSTDALRQLPAESIEKVEVITSPSARYDAEGTAGILNIILKRNKLEGLNGSLTSNLGFPWSYGISGNLNYRTKNVNFFTTVGYRANNGPGNIYNLTQYLNNANGVDLPDTYLQEKRNTDRERKGLTINPGLEWYLNKSTSLTASMVYRDGNNKYHVTNEISQFDENMNLLSLSERLDPEEEEDKTYQFALNFNKDFKKDDHKLTFDIQYEDDDELEASFLTDNGVNSEFVQTNTNNKEWLIQSDYVLPIGENSRFEAGFRSQLGKQVADYRVDLYNEANQNYERDTNVSNLLNFDQNINAIYSQYGSKFDKFSFLTGLRLENTQIIIDQPTSGDYSESNYLGLFPTLNLNYEISKVENVMFGYARRIRRPNHWFLNPFPSRSSLSSVYQGNPALAPSFSGIFDLGYLKRFEKITFSSSIYYQRATDVYNIINFDTGNTVIIDGREVPVVQSTPVNLSVNNRYGFEMNVNYTPMKKWRINSNINVFKSITEGEYNGVSYDANNLTWTARLNSKLTLFKSLEWQTTMNYRGPTENTQIRTKGIFSMNMAFSKDLFKDKASLTFRINDVFNSRKRRSITETATYVRDSEFQWRERSFTLSFTYRFNQKKGHGPRRNNRSGGGEGGY